MRLFYKIYTCLLIGIVLLLTIEGYINYRDEIARFRLDPFSNLHPTEDSQ